ncbi:MAG: hypothetical protein WDO24_04130 [Pseudomonadota bacterium]
MIANFLAELGIWFTPYAWAGHVLLGLAIQLAVALPLRGAGVRGAWWLGAAVSIGFWWGPREDGVRVRPQGRRQSPHGRSVLVSRLAARRVGPGQPDPILAPAAINLAVAALARRMRHRPS